MTALLVTLLIAGTGIIAWLYINKTNNFKDKDKNKEQLPVENHEVEKPKIYKKPYKSKSQTKKK